MTTTYERGPDPKNRGAAGHGRRPAGTRRRTGRTLVALGAVATLALAACGDDDDAADAAPEAPVAPAATAAPPTTAAPTPAAAEDPSAPTGTFAPEFAEYCGLILELGDAFPTPEQVEALRAAAPDEISAPVAVVAEAFIAAADDPASAFADPAVGEALGPIEEFEARECGIVPEEEGPPQDPSVTALDPAATRVDVSATDFMFHGDFPTAAGRYSFVMSNDGEAAHLLILAKLAEGVTLEEAMASEGEEGIEAMFESELAPAGGEAVLTADLTPGTWVLVCPLPGPGGQDHAQLGMVHELTIS